MKKRYIVLLIILAFLLVVLTIGGVWVYKNWNTVTTMYYVFTGKTEQVQTNKVDTDKRAEEAIKDFGIDSIRPLNEEEIEKLKSGELTEEEAIKIVLGKTDEISNTSTSQNSTNSNKDNSTTDKKELTSEEIKQKNDEIASLIGKMYVLKAKFNSELASVESWVHSEYAKYRKLYEGEVPSSEKMKIGSAAYSKALSLEADCDGQVKGILDNLTVLLKETGQNTNLVSEIQAAYENEKMVAKSLYMSKI